MKAYTIFDDFDNDAAKIIKSAGIELTIHPKGKPRPDLQEIKTLLDNYDIIMISTAQKITSEMLNKYDSKKIIATVSIGKDHIQISDNKKDNVKIVNAPTASAVSVAEYVFGTILTHKKRIIEGNTLFSEGKDKKHLLVKPVDLYGKTIGVIGAGTISVKIIQIAIAFGMNIVCYTYHPENHPEIRDMGISFIELNELIKTSDIISLNMPSNDVTRNMISSEKIDLMKNDACFVSVSRLDLVDINALEKKALNNPMFTAALDVDLFSNRSICKCKNIILTPHIAGGTVESRKRMFVEVSQNIVNCLKEWRY